MTELHHIGYLVTDIFKAAEEFSERFGYTIESPIIEDPQQTACVQFLRQPAALHWLELIAPNGAGSKLAKALERGGGMHHFCYEVASIGLASETLRHQGMLPLGDAKPAVAFSGRPIAWFMDRGKLLVELVEAGPGDFSLSSLRKISVQPR
jgi:methylmalonyl-CoA/ethylmalonyl-CoA epimerase